MKPFKELRNLAVQSLTGYWGNAAIITLVYVIISGGLSSLGSYSGGDIAGLIVTLVLLPIQWGYYVLFLDKVRGNEVGFGHLISGYNDFSRICGTLFLQSIYVLLWSLLLLIPGIVKAYSYAMTPYVLNDNSELSYNAAITRSSQLMKGQKLNLFLLHLSFIGWAILSVLSLGIGFLFLSPYMHAAEAHFYETLLKEEAAKAPVIAEESAADNN